MSMSSTNGKTLILSVQTLPPVINGDKCKYKVRELQHDHKNLLIIDGDISIARSNRNKQSATPDKRNIIFKLSRRDLVGEIYSTCKGKQPPFLSTTPLRQRETKPSTVCFN